MNISSIIVPAILALLYTAIYAASGKRVSVGKDNKTIIRFPLFLKIVSVFCLLVSIAVIVALSFFEPEELDTTGIVIIGLLSAGSFYISLQSKNHYVQFDDEWIEVRNAFGRTRMVQWKQLVDVEFLPFSKFIKLKDKEGSVVYISTYLEGLDQFMDMFEAKTKWARTVIPLRQNRKF